MTDRNDKLATPDQVQEVKIGKYPLSQVVNEQLWKRSEIIEQIAHVPFPVTALDNLPPMYEPKLTVVHIKESDTYPVSGKLGLGKNVILKMLSATGCKVYTRKLSDRSNLDYIEWQAKIKGKTPDGREFEMTATRTWDWKTCQETAKSQSDALQQKKFSDEMTETKAILRAARAVLNLPHAMTKEEIKKPVIIASSVFKPDMNDHEIRRMYAAREMGVLDLLYPTKAEALPAATEDFEEQTPALEAPEDHEERVEAEAVEDAEFTDADDPGPAAPVNPKLQRVCIMCNEVFRSDPELRAWLVSEFDVASRKELSDDQLSLAIEKLNRLIDQKSSSSSQGGDDIDSQLADVEKKLGSDRFEQVLGKLGKTTLEGCKPAVKKAALDYAQAVLEGKIEL